jgi:signal transduction histidine kinase
MGARTLEARLTTRLVALAGGVLLAVGLASVVVTARVLDASDTEAARARATRVCEALAREQRDGDSPEEALREAIASEQAAGVLLAVRSEAGGVAGVATLPALAPGSCKTVTGESRQPWRACAARAEDGSVVVAAVSISGHRGVVGALLRGMGAVVLVALGGLWFAVRRALRGPLSELGALVRWTAAVADAEPPRPPPEVETLEIAQLESAFDALVRRLLDALARERASSAHIAHELRTPLAAMVAELGGLRPADEPSRAAIGRVLGDAARFADAIDAILVLSSPGRPGERGEAIVNVADVVRDLAPEAAAVEAPDEALVVADERLVRLALRNLVDNAGKYASGARLLRVSREGEAVRLSVIDDGPGLEGPARERMFERYWRGSADGEGRGLGLALVRAVAERHGGRAEARTGHGGRGLEVSMTLDGLAGWHAEAPGR